MGRDTLANSLFARLGTTALQAEDYFLLGVGLNHAGQKEAAGKVWEQGLVMGPGHAEMIEQLMILDTAMSRPTEAAQLAEQLARQPGWELRGELSLGNLRAEMSDPAGAAATLRRGI